MRRDGERAGGRGTRRERKGRREGKGEGFYFVRSQLCTVVCITSLYANAHDRILSFVLGRETHY